MSEEIRERWKLEDKVFDRRSLIALSKVLSKGIIKTIDFPISRGKEAHVYRGTTAENTFVAIKIYKIETTSFLRRMEYIEGDPRFHLNRRTLSEVVYTFTKKEYKNLSIADNAKIPAPKPLFSIKNILIMSFLGQDGNPYMPLYKNSKILEVEHFEQIVDSLTKLYANGLVHGDLSEYNILLGDKPYIIDFAQGVILKHPKAEEFLKRDIINLLSFFKKYIKLDYTSDEVLKRIHNK